MPYSIDRSQSLESLHDYLVGVEAGLLAMEQTQDLGPKWAHKQVEVKKLREERDEARKAVIGAQARVKVLDTRWDMVVAKISDRAYSLAGKDADVAPYEPLFGAVTAQEAKEYGPAKATAFGKSALAKLHELNEAELNPLADELAKANVALGVAHAARGEAEDAAAIHTLRKERLIEQVEALVAEAEIAILTRFPRQKALVASVLSPVDPARSRSKKAAPSDGPATVA